MPDHVIQQGECVASLAYQYGFHWRRLWQLPQNQSLRAKRPNPNILYPGDILYIPDKQLRSESRSTTRRHPFVKKTEPVKLKIRLLAAGKPVANEPYQLKIDSAVLAGTTDPSGILIEVIPPGACAAQLVLTRARLEYQLEIGHLDPLTEVSGLQARLNNLGYHCGSVDGILGPLTRSALKTFQETYQLKLTGEPDAATLDKLKSEYGS
jgi:hypothetical protein